MSLIRHAGRVLAVSGAVVIGATTLIIPSALADSTTGTSTFQSAGTADTGTGASGSGAASPDAVDYCTDSATVTTPGDSEADGSGRTTCSEAGSVVDHVTLTIWEKVGSGYRNLGTFTPKGGPTPYFTGVKTARCTPGDNIHVFYATRVLTPDGVYISDPGANTTPAPCEK